MNELEYFRLLEKAMTEPKKFGRVIVIVNKNTWMSKTTPLNRL